MESVQTLRAKQLEIACVILDAFCDEIVFASDAFWFRGQLFLFVAGKKAGEILGRVQMSQRFKPSYNDFFISLDFFEVVEGGFDTAKIGSKMLSVLNFLHPARLCP